MAKKVYERNESSDEEKNCEDLDCEEAPSEDEESPTTSDKEFIEKDDTSHDQDFQASAKALKYSPSDDDSNVSDSDGQSSSSEEPPVSQKKRKKPAKKVNYKNNSHKSTPPAKTKGTSCIFCQGKSQNCRYCYMNNCRFCGQKECKCSEKTANNGRTVDTREQDQQNDCIIL